MPVEPESAPAQGPLQGLRIVECAGLIAGPYCGKLLAGLGADVVKVEPLGGDASRAYGPFPGDVPDAEKSGLFLYLNTNKRGVVLDLATPGGRASLHRLLAGADILIEDWPRREADAAGLGYGELHRQHRRLQVVSVTPFGCSGPYRDRPASDLTVFHASGMAFETPQNGVDSLELPPLRPGGYSSSFLAGTVAAAATITGALYDDALGHHVDVSHLEALTSVMLRISLHQHTYEGKTPVRLRATDRQVNYLPCKDGYVNAYVHQPNWWQGLVKAMGDPDWAHDPLFHQADFRTQAWDLLEPLLEAWAKDYTRQQLFELLQRHHVPCLPGYTFEDVVKDAHLNARGYFQDIDDGDRGRWRFPGPPSRLSRTPFAPVRPAPRLGEHNGLLAGSASGWPDETARYWSVPSDVGPLGTAHPEQFDGAHHEFVEGRARGPTGPVLSNVEGLTTSGFTTLDSGGIDHHPAPLSPRLGAASAPKRTPDAAPGLPLEGLRVVDFSWVFAGPTSTLLLANAGADVIKVETTLRPDATREQRAFSGGRAERVTGGGFDGLNFSKRSITLNLKDPRAVHLAKRLVAVSDVVVENYARGVMGRFGLGYDELRKIRPDLIMLSMTLFGQDGPYRDYFGYGGPLPVFTGLASITGHPGGTPQTVGASWPDPLNGVNAAIALLAAVRHRRRTGEGQHIDLSMAEGALATLPLGVMEYAVNGRVLGLEGNRDPHAAPHNVYRCRGDDQWVAIAVETEARWRALCEAFKHPEWLSDPRFASLPFRKANEDALDRLVDEWTRDKGKNEVAELLLAHMVPAAASLNRAEVVAGPHLQERNAFVPITSPVDGRERLVSAAPWHISGRPDGRYEQPPTVGQHNLAVFRDLLGLNQEEVNEMRTAGALD